MSLTYFLTNSFGDDIHLFYNPLARFWEITSGAIISQLEIAYFREILIKNNKIIEILSFFALSFIVIPMFYLKGHVYQSIWILLPVTGASLAILLCEENYKKTLIHRKILSSKLLGYVGTISYPLYLVHWPIISFSSILYGDASNQILFKIMIIIISVSLSSLIYLYMGLGYLYLIF